MPPTEDAYSNAEIARSLKRIEDKVDAIAAGYVPRTEFDTRMTAVDREIRDLKDAQKAGRLSWPQVATALVAVATLVILLVTTLSQQ